MDGLRTEVCGQQNSQTTPTTTSTTPVRQLPGAADAQTAHHATSSTAPAHQPLGSANAGNDTSRSRKHDPIQHAKGRTSDCPGPHKETTTRRNVTRRGGGLGKTMVLTLLYLGMGKGKGRGRGGALAWALGSGLHFLALGGNHPSATPPLHCHTLLPLITSISASTPRQSKLRASRWIFPSQMHPCSNRERTTHAPSKHYPHPCSKGDLGSAKQHLKGGDYPAPSHKAGTTLRVPLGTPLRVHRLT